ncbi:acyl-CoA thioesterase [Salibacterium aidingense]|uniref:acyl-CoA thioesterase n=1 Tax=Salibacterium aidingense TaxID=384933 RepID=UPI00040D57F5|nr:thioesterase family protein [Salibacterium aidingense]
MAYKWEIKVRASETDGLGHVSNISYFIYLEEARIELFRELNGSMDLENWPFILASASCDYVQQAYFDEVLQISTTVQHIGRSSFTLHHEITCERGVIARGRSVVVHFDFEAQKSAPLPETWRSILSEQQSANN